MPMQVAPAHIQLEDKAKKSILVGIFLFYFNRVLFTFTVPVIMPSVMEEYGLMGWYAIQSGLNALMSCIAMPIGGKIGDIFGRRKVFLLGGYTTLGLSLLCSIRLTGPLFFGLYTVISFLNGLIGSYTASMISDVTTTRERPRLFGIMSTINGIGVVIGLPLGGIIADYLGAFWGFAVYVPLGVIGILLIARYYPNRPADHHVAVDKMGIGLIACSFGSILAWCFFGGVLFPRVSAIGITLLVLGGIFLVILLRAESRIEEPLLDLKMFRHKAFTASFLTYLFIAPMPNLCSSVLILYGKMGLGLSATVASTLAMPKNIVFCILPTFMGIWLGRQYKNFRRIFILCGATIAIGSFISASWGLDTALIAIYLTMILFGVATSCQATAVQLCVQVSLPQKDLGVASSMVIFGNSVGSALYNAFYNIVYNSKYNAAMALGGGEHMAQAMTDVFSAMSILSAVCGVAIVILNILIVPQQPQHEKE